MALRDTDWGRTDGARREASVLAPVALVLGLGVGFTVFRVLRVILLNAVGPFPEQAVLAVVLTVLGALLGGLLAAAGVWWVGRRSWLLAASLVVGMVAAAWVVSPATVSSSRAGGPEGLTCTGWEIRYFPVASNQEVPDVYCIGIAHPITPD